LPTSRYTRAEHKLHGGLEEVINVHPLLHLHQCISPI